jgi:hypothetical protein
MAARKPSAGTPKSVPAAKKASNPKTDKGSKPKLASAKRADVPTSEKTTKKSSSKAVGAGLAPAPFNIVPPTVTPVSKRNTVKELPAKIFQSETSIELPVSYGEERLTLMARDPWWVFAYWEIAPDRIQNLVRQHAGLRGVLRFRDARGQDQDFEQEVHLDHGRCYVAVEKAEAVLSAEIGLKDGRGAFHSLLGSNTVRLPRREVSTEEGSAWGHFNDPEQEIYRLSGGMEWLNGVGFETRLDRPLLHSLALQSRQKPKNR